MAETKLHSPMASTNFPATTEILARRQQNQRLSTQILNRYVESKFDDEHPDFLPHGCVDELVTSEAITEALSEHHQSNPEDLEPQARSTKREVVDFVLNQNAKKVFAITVLCELSGKDLETAIRQFIKFPLTDSCLPVNKGYLTNHSSDTAFLWSKVKDNNFFLNQWAFLAPVFSPESYNFDLKANHILPFVEVYNDTDTDSTRTSGSSQVFEVKIHEAHHMNPVPNEDGVRARLAIKEFIINTNDETKQKDAEEVWKSEVATLDSVTGLRHDHLIQRIAAIKRGSKRYLMFLWAEDGNLRNFWIRDPKPKLTANFIKNIIMQLRGMADGILKLHKYSGQRQYRHGDIKPENILIFPDRKRSPIGTFKIADFGAAKDHNLPTGLRNLTAGKAFATMVYQPPEAITNPLSATSRRYDIWSMGCVTLEFMVWLLYGYDGLRDFNASVIGDQGKHSSFFVAIQVEQPDTTAGWRVEIHPAVQTCLQELFKDQECLGKTALGDLLKVVETKLLVVALSEEPKSTSEFPNVQVTDTDATSNINRPSGSIRATAEEFVQALDSILHHESSEDDGYWFTGQSRRNMRLPGTISRSVIKDNASQQGGLSVPGNMPASGLMVDHTRNSSVPDLPVSPVFLPGQAQTVQDRVHLSPYWSYPVDNEFAGHVLRDMGISVAKSDSPSPSHLCGKCKRMNFLVSRLRIEDTWSDLESSRSFCDFCRMRWEVSRHLDRKDHHGVSFNMKDSMLRMNDSELPSLSVCRSPELQTVMPIQIGFPQLPEATSESHFMMLRQWLKNCNDNHHKFGCQSSETTFLPTRLIDVGPVGSETIRLCETQGTGSLKYLALSHPWGQKGQYFCTFTKDIENYKNGINIKNLTPTFKDAVTITRELGVQYLWIDSICIIQGDASGQGDFVQEAQHMEHVFSSAYCVLAASSAEGQSDGFLNKREGSSRKFVTFQHEDQHPFYVCSFIDDFNQHVLEGPLSKRGWVMQERVLARRTIYFTNKQTYWECGEGVRCETLTRLENKLASFLADPNFPAKITSNVTNRGERIVFYENLYKQYSRLAFTRWEDRPIAIAGLQNQLIQDLNTRGGFGVFDDEKSLLRRSLLWQRGKDQETMEKIEFPPERNLIVPTWSWMAYKGGIDFLELPLGGVDWEEDEIYSPWNHDPSEEFLSADQTRNIELSVVARGFATKDVRADEVLLIYDDSSIEHQPLLCVVMGKKKAAKGEDEKPPEEARHYVLLIEPKIGATNVYERVGVGFMSGKCIKVDTKGPSKLVKVY